MPYSFSTPTSGPLPGADYAAAVNTEFGEVATALNAQRERLSANRTYYVRTDGSDSNTGLANTAGGAFLTIQKAIDVAQTLDANGFNITIQVGAGTFSGNIVLPSPVLSINGGYLWLYGIDASGSTILTSASGDTINCYGNGLLQIGNVELRSTANNALICTDGGSIYLDTGVRFGTTNAAHVKTSNTGVIYLNNAYSIIGAAHRHIYAISGGYIEQYGACTLVGSLAFNVFATCSQNANIEGNGGFSGGTITGKRYEADLNGVIQTWVSGANYFPGNSAGSTATGGQYA